MFRSKVLLLLLFLANLLNLPNSEAQVFNNPYLFRKDCSGVKIEDTTPGFGWRIVDFGDGTPQTTQLTHNYSNSGTYAIKYLRYNSVNSAVVDSFVDSISISIFLWQTTPNLIVSGIGITQFTLNTINKISSYYPGSGIYDDFTCSDQTTLEQGQRYPITIFSAGQQTQFATVYIDLNSSGTFDRNEIVGRNAGIGQQTFNITIPKIDSLLIGQPLRLRIILSSLSITPLYKGNSTYYINDCEDYTVYIQNNINIPPVASFEALYSCDGLNVHFQSTSQGAPDSIVWYHPDGSSISNFVHPIFQYSNPDSQWVDLVVYKQFGRDSIHSILHPPNRPEIIYSTPAIINQPVTFSTPQYMNVYNWLWTFPEGPSQSSSPVATHSYLSQGIYPVTLSILYGFENLPTQNLIYCNGTIDDTVNVLLNLVSNVNDVASYIKIHNGLASKFEFESEDYGKISISIIKLNGELENEYYFYKSEKKIEGIITFQSAGIYIFLLRINNLIYTKKQYVSE